MLGAIDWGASQWTAITSVIGAAATTIATIYAAKAARAAERSIEAQYRPQIVLQFVRRDEHIFLQMVNAGSSARSITLRSYPPIADSTNRIITERPELEQGVSVLLPHDTKEFLFDGFHEYFNLEFILRGRSVDFDVTVTSTAAMLDQMVTTQQQLSLRPLIPRTPRVNRGLDYAVKQIDRWSAEGESEDDRAEQQVVVQQLEEAANEEGLGYVNFEVGDGVHQFLGHLGWSIDSQEKDGKLLFASKLFGSNRGERIASAGWSPLIALVRLTGFAHSVNQESSTAELQPEDFGDSAKA